MLSQSIVALRVGHVVDVNVDNDLLSFEPPTAESADLTRIIHADIDSKLRLRLQPVFNYDQIKTYPDKTYDGQLFDVTIAIDHLTHEKSIFALLDYLFDQQHGSPNTSYTTAGAYDWLGELSADQETKVYKTLDMSDIKFDTLFSEAGPIVTSSAFQLSTDPQSPNDDTFRHNIADAMVGTSNTFMREARDSLGTNQNNVEVSSLEGNQDSGYYTTGFLSYKSALAKLFFSSDSDQKYSVETYSDTLQDPVIHSFISRIAPMLLGFHNEIAAAPTDNVVTPATGTSINADEIVKFAEFHLRRLVAYGDWENYAPADASDDGSSLLVKDEFPIDENYDENDFHTLKQMFNNYHVKKIYEDVKAHHEKTMNIDGTSVREKLIDFIDAYNDYYAGTVYTDVEGASSELSLGDLNNDAKLVVVKDAAEALRNQIEASQNPITFTDNVTHATVNLNAVNIIQPVRITHDFSTQLWDIVFSRPPPPS